jgi:hypothetical protein
MMMERKDIEGRSAHDVASRLKTAFDAYCAPQPR